MIPPQKFGNAVFMNPCEGKFIVADNGKTICDTNNPIEAMIMLESCFESKIHNYLLPKILAEGYNRIGEKVHDGGTVPETDCSQ